MTKKKTNALATRRFSILSEEEMSDRQSQMVKEFKGFSLNGMRGPFNMMLRSPEAAKRFQALGEYLRFETKIDNRLVELLVLIHARIWTGQYEWMLHEPRAIAAGLDQHKVDSLQLGKVPKDLSSDEQAVLSYVIELEINKKVSDATFINTKKELGEQIITDIVFMLGQYTTISMALSVLEETADEVMLPPCQYPFADYFVN